MEALGAGIDIGQPVHDPLGLKLGEKSVRSSYAPSARSSYAPSAAASASAAAAAAAAAAAVVAGAAQDNSSRSQAAMKAAGGRSYSQAAASAAAAAAAAAGALPPSFHDQPQHGSACVGVHQAQTHSLSLEAVAQSCCCIDPQHPACVALPWPRFTPAACCKLPAAELPAVSQRAACLPACLPVCLPALPYLPSSDRCSACSAALHWC